MNERASKESKNKRWRMPNGELDWSAQNIIPYISRISLLVLTTYLLVAQDVLGIDALLRKNSHFLASRFFTFFYNQKQESSLIVLFDDQYLRCGLGGGISCDENNNHGKSWPAPFTDHAAVLRTILHANPYVIFYDIVFRPRTNNDSSQDNKSNNDNVFIKYLTEAKNNKDVMEENDEKIPIILGYLEGKKYDPIYKHIKNNQYAAISWSGYGDFIPHYSVYDRKLLEHATPENLHKEYMKYLDGANDFPPPLLPTAAFRLYQECLKKEEKDDFECRTNNQGKRPASFQSEFNDPLFVYWGAHLKERPAPFQSIKEKIESTKKALKSTNSAPNPSIFTDIQYTTLDIFHSGLKVIQSVIQPIDLLSTKIKLALVHIINTEILFNSKGAYARYADKFNTIPAIGVRELIRLNKEDRRKLIGNKAIFIGADISGLPDKVTSPIEGILPGVYYHAMAFDNLVQLGSSYKTDGEAGKIFGLSWADQLENMAFILLSLIYWLAHILENRFWPRKPLKNATATSAARFGYDLVIASKRFVFYTILAILSYCFLSWCIYYSWHVKHWDSGNLLGLLSISIPLYFFLQSFIELLVSFIYWPIRKAAGQYYQYQ